MINNYLIEPKSIVVVGGSNDFSKPGGRLVSNLVRRNDDIELYVVNRSGETVQGNTTFATIDELPTQIDLAILAIPAQKCVETVQQLGEKNGTKAFIIISAGFSEAGDVGKQIENDLRDTINHVNGCLIGPNCIGFLNKNYAGVFTLPIPKTTSKGCDLISSSGATAVFLMEAGMPLGIKYANVYSLGNAAQIGVEDVLEYMDQHFDPTKDPKIKLLYLETIKDPKRFQKHALSLVKKGAKIAAIKAGSTEEGSRAAASHTGALSSSDEVIRALFKKSNVIYCSGRMELLSVASIFHYGEIKGENIAIITHAGGSAVMLTDALVEGGLKVPKIKNEWGEKLLGYLNAGSSVQNPIDFLATGTAEQLGMIIDFCEHKFDEIDAMVVVFGSPGLFNVKNVYDVLSVKLQVCSKPIYPVLPSVINAQQEIQDFLSKGHINFPDEVALGKALGAVHQQQLYSYPENKLIYAFDKEKVRSIIDQSADAFLPQESCKQLMEVIGVPYVTELIVSSLEELEAQDLNCMFPLAMKLIGPIHKTDIGGVVLNIGNNEDAKTTFNHLMQLDQAKGVMIQPMLSGNEFFIGVKRESNFGHMIFCGLGGVFIEILQDFSSALCPIDVQEAERMLNRLKGNKLFDGYRGQDKIDKEFLAELVSRVSYLTQIAPEIEELDINPLMNSSSGIQAVDVRIKINRDDVY